MIATQNQQANHKLSDNTSPSEKIAIFPHELDLEVAMKRFKHLSLPPQLLLEISVIPHKPKAGLNPLADAAGYLFSILGKLKQRKAYSQVSKLQKEIIQEICIFQENSKNLGYNTERIIVSRYVLCATFDDIIANTTWGGRGQWDSYSLLAAFNQDTLHQDKFFNILDHAIKEPTLYIDLMELIYVCLSLGYKGQYRSTEHNQFQLEQITSNLYKHIRAFRGGFSKNLSPFPIKATKPMVKTTRPKNHSHFIFNFFVTACTVMTIFVSLGYLMDVISNEAYKNIVQIETSLVKNTGQ